MSKLTPIYVQQENVVSILRKKRQFMRLRRMDILVVNEEIMMADRTFARLNKDPESFWVLVPARMVSVVKRISHHPSLGEWHIPDYVFVGIVGVAKWHRFTDAEKEQLGISFDEGMMLRDAYCYRKFIFR